MASAKKIKMEDPIQFGASPAHATIVHLDRTAPKATESYDDAIMARIAAGGPKEFREVRISPALAQRMLDLNTKNRTLSPRQAAKNARAMQRGEWEENGETIKFSTDGQLIDGQHRLTAIIATGMTITLDVCFGLKPRAQRTLDTGRKRTVADQLSIENVPYSHHTSAAVKWLYTLVTGEPNIAIDAPEVESFLDQHPNLIDSVKLVCSNKKFRGSASLMSAIHYIGTEYQNAGALADKFVQVLRDGIPDTRYDNPKLDPAYKLREKYSGMRKLQPSRNAQLDDIIYAWNAFRVGRSVSQFRPSEGQLMTAFKPESLGIVVMQPSTPVLTVAKRQRRRLEAAKAAA